MNKTTIRCTIFSCLVAMSGAASAAGTPDAAPASQGVLLDSLRATIMSWAQHSGGMGKIHFLADWDASFTKAMGLDMDLSAGALGVRSKRYSMLVEDGVVKSLNIEENPGQATVSSAATMIEQL